MDQLVNKLQDFVPATFDMGKFLDFALCVLISTLVLSLIARAVFGRRSTMNYAISSAAAILAIYLLYIVVAGANPKLRFFFSPLPFVSVSGDDLHIFSLLNADIFTICRHAVDMLVLSFIMNLLESYLPKGKNIFSWYLFRFMSLVLAISLHYVVHLLFDAILPSDVAEITALVLLCILLFVSLLAALKLLCGKGLGGIDSLLTFLHKFFFKNKIGVQLNRAILTTVLLTAVVLILNLFGISSVCISISALAAYIPFILVMLLLWYIIGHIM